MATERENTGLHNWRAHPQSQWAFQNVNELIPTAAIAACNDATSLETELQNLESLEFDSPKGKVSLESLAHCSYSDSIVILHKGKVVYQWFASHSVQTRPHIIFSISKSLTAIIAGVLEDQGVIDSDREVAHYLPNAKQGVYGNCRLRELLDMTVSLNLEENYTDPESEYQRYRESTGWNPSDPDALSLDLEAFLYTLSKGAHDHGEVFAYRSPNTDLLGLVLERSSGKSLPQLYSELLWKPLGMQADGYVTVDRKGLARAAGGICIPALDLTRVGQLFLDHGQAFGKQLVSERWIYDTCFNGSQSAWDRGNFKARMPNGKYRNMWYQSGDADKTICARGIHGQLLYINAKRSVVIARLSSHPDPLNDVTTDTMMASFQVIARELG